MGMMAPEVRAEEIITRLPNGVTAGAEIGVFKGQLSAILLRRLPSLKLYMVDSWAPTEAQPQAYKACDDFHAGLSGEKQERCFRDALETVRFAIPHRALVMRMDSLKAAARIPDASLDFVFIDGDHSAEGCAADLKAWAPKVKRGGLLCGHDYDHPIKTKFGVKDAVDEMIQACEWVLELGKDMTWFVRL
jgi:predicted O-methyltransferase YrrM